jgi:hypothetical protein
MPLEDELKAKTLALISGQMANWVVEIQRSIADHQANLVRMLDELQESVARYDERINEGEIGAAMSEVVAANPVAAPAGGGGISTLRSSIAAIEKGTSLSEVLTFLVNEVSGLTDRSAMFIVKGTNAIGWYARGFQAPEAVKTINVPLTADTIFRNVNTGKKPLRGHISQTPGTAQALARLGPGQQGVIAVPLVLKDRIAAILYGDSQSEEIPSEQADAIEVLVLFAGKVIDLLSSLPKPAAAPVSTATNGTTSDRAAAIRADGPEVRARAGVPPPRPAAAAPPMQEEGASTVMFNAQTFSQMRQATAPAARPAAPPARPAAPVAPPSRALSPDEQKAHEEAKRFARLVVSEIKLYNESKVSEGRRNKDLYERLKEDIERGRQMYSDRVAPPIRDTTNYFYDELVRILAGGDASALGPM